MSCVSKHPRDPSITPHTDPEHGIQVAQGGLEPPRPPVPMVRFYRRVQDLEDEAPPLSALFCSCNMLQLVDASFLQTVVFFDLRRDLVRMCSINDPGGILTACALVMLVSSLR